MAGWARKKNEKQVYSVPEMKQVGLRYTKWSRKQIKYVPYRAALAATGRHVRRSVGRFQEIQNREEKRWPSSFRKWFRMVRSSSWERVRFGKR